jgi:tetratricopeptide (TPR) repeat protein
MNAAARAGRLEEARELLRANDARGLVALLGEMERDVLVAEPELGFLLATGLRRVGESARAFDLTSALEPACERRGRDPLWRSRLNLEAALRLERGEAAAAESAWRVLVDAASAADDAGTLARAHNNLGIIFTLQGRWEEALASHGRALAANHRLGDRRGLAQAHQNVAICYRELGFTRQADAHFRSAIDEGLGAGSEDVVGRAEEERALLILLQRDPRLARATAKRALDRLHGIGDVTGEGEALRVLGLVAMAEGDTAGAGRLLRDALAKSKATGAALLEAETLQALAVLAGGRVDPDVAGRAAELFDAFGARGWGEHVRRRTERLKAEGERSRPRA